LGLEGELKEKLQQGRSERNSVLRTRKEMGQVIGRGHGEGKYIGNAKGCRHVIKKNDGN